MVGVKYFLDICIISAHKAHLREKNGFFGPFFFSIKFLECVPVGCKSCELRKKFQTSFYNPRDLPYQFWVFSKIKDPPEKSWGEAKNDPQKTGFFDITSTLLLQHCKNFF